MPPPPPLVDDAIEGILLRLPPDDPAALLRAALVCKRWCRIVCGRAFRRRLGELHRPAPMLGFFSSVFGRGSAGIRFVPTSATCPPLAERCPGWCVLDSRHGRVLVNASDSHTPETVLVVWDPVSGEQRELPAAPGNPHLFTAAVLCADAACHHLSCHRGPFLVVLMGRDMGGVFACIYSSETGVWSEPAAGPDLCHLKGSDSSVPVALVGNALYFPLAISTTILKYDLGTGEISVIPVPNADSGHIVLMAMEDGQPGFAIMEETSLVVWLRDPTNHVGWAQSIVIDLRTLLPADVFLGPLEVLAYADGVGVVFIAAVHDIFSVELKSRQVKRFPRGNHVLDVVPFSSFYTPALGAAAGEDQQLVVD